MVNNYKTASFWKNEARHIRCQLCPHACLLREGETGICQTRKNVNGQLITLAWNNLCAAGVDAIEKKPLFHFLPGHRSFSISTKGCNLRCLNCQNYHISQTSPGTGTTAQAESHQITSSALKYNCRSIAYTYTEPTVYYEYMSSIAKTANEAGLKNVMISSGYINPKPLKALIPILDAVNIDLKAFDDQTYRNLCGATLKPVLRSMETILNAGLCLEITCLIIPELTDHPDMIHRMCKWLVENGFKDTPIHFSRFYPVYQLSHLNPTSPQRLEEILQIAIKSGLNYIYLGNMPGHTSENTFCPNCRYKIIERSGNAIILSHLTKGRCPECHTAIPGVFD